MPTLQVTNALNEKFNSYVSMQHQEQEARKLQDQFDTLDAQINTMVPSTVMHEQLESRDSIFCERLSLMAKEEQRVRDMDRVTRKFQEAENRDAELSSAVTRALKQTQDLNEAMKHRVLQQDFEQLYQQTMMLPTHDTIQRLND